ncbi:hypothetical protein JMG10_05520 [Nostoc ellipsosporum NOK]|nr:hypothetical protein [Nostoc ellipsosporum NOK]
MKKSAVSRLSVAFVALLAFTTTAWAQPKLAAFFSDGMVLQQQTDAAIWGQSAAGKTVKVTTSWDRKSYSVRADEQGRWKIRVRTPKAGGPYEISISDGKTIHLRDVLVGEVWLCSGQSNMEMPVKGYRDQPVTGSNEAIFSANNSQLRFFTVPRATRMQPQDTVKSANWKTAIPENVADFSATAYFFGRQLQQTLNVPVGLMQISFGGSSAEAWMNEEALAAFPAIKKVPAADSAKLNQRSPMALYNGMLKPFIGYAIRGCIWYQGESNYERPDEYETLFPAMVSLWRKEFGQGDFPFYFAQIAPYNYSQLPPYNTGGKYNSAYLRDAQRKALDKIPNSGMIVLMDIGEENCIHPSQKAVGGQRFAYLALGDTYGKKGFAYKSPLPDSIRVQNGTVVIRFKNAPTGLTSFGKPLVNFEIAGADKYWRPARAVISKGELHISSPEIKEPVAVRYAFKDFVVGELFNTAGLPVPSFRTDKWE